MKQNSVKIHNFEIGTDHPCFLIAEAGLSHEGSLGIAHSIIDAATKAGANAVKFQTHLAEFEGTINEKFRVNSFPQDKTRKDYWNRTSFTKNQWKELKDHVEENNLAFLSSAFSEQSVDLLMDIGIRAWKIPSGESNNLPLLEKICTTKLPILLSTGMSYTNEIEKSVSYIKSQNIPLVLYQCSNIYPCPPEKLGLNLIPEFHNKFKIPIGLSDHSGTIFSGLAAKVLGASSLEVHVTFHNSFFGPDVSSSLTFEKFGELVKGIRFLERAINPDFDKDRSADELKETRLLFTKSIVASENTAKGTMLEREHLCFKKPGDGIPSSDYEKLLGKTLSHSINKDQKFTWDMIQK